MSDVPPKPDAPRKPRARTSRLTWAVAVAALVAAVAGGAWAYYNVGPGRTVDTSGIRPGMKLVEVEEVLGKPDEVFTVGDEVAWRYGRTHVWFIGTMQGNIVTEVTNGPREPGGKSNAVPKTKGFGGKRGGGEKGPPGPEAPKPGENEK